MPEQPPSRPPALKALPYTSILLLDPSRYDNKRGLGPAPQFRAPLLTPPLSCPRTQHPCRSPLGGPTSPPAPSSRPSRSHARSAGRLCGCHPYKALYVYALPTWPSPVPPLSAGRATLP